MVTTLYTADQAARQMTHDYWGGSSHAYVLSVDRGLSVDLTALSQDARQVATWAMEAWTTLTGIVFEEVASNAAITFQDDAGGAYSASTISGETTISSTVNISQAWLDKNGTAFNTYSVMTYLHEIGHALGLGHPGNYDGGAVYGESNLYANDSWQMSVLSYFSQSENTSIDASYAYAMTPMLADITAMRVLYGQFDLRTGDTTYGDGSTAGGTYDRISDMRDAGTLGEEVAWTIVDDGGFDTLDLRSSTADQLVDLRPEQASSVYGLTGNLMIAEGSTLEQILTGAGDDMVYGHTGATLVHTGAGADTVYGGSGADEIHGEGTQANTLMGNDGDDIIYAGAGDDLIAGGADNDALYGGDGANTIYLGLGDDLAGGGAGNDVIYGGAGANRIYGGLGNDTVQGGVDSDTIFGGGNGSNTLLGNNGNDVIVAGDGGDLLGGGNGDDVIYGGAGSDTIYLGGGNDFVGGGSGNDVILAGVGSNRIYGGLGDDTVHSGIGRDVITGSPGADVFVFASAAHAGIAAARDVITDFEVGIDKIDLSALDLRFVEGAFTATAGELCYIPGYVIGDTDGDGQNDFTIEMSGNPSLTVDDFIL